PFPPSLFLPSLRTHARCLSPPTLLFSRLLRPPRHGVERPPSSPHCLSLRRESVSKEGDGEREEGKQAARRERGEREGEGEEGRRGERERREESSGFLHPQLPFLNQVQVRDGERGKRERSARERGGEREGGRWVE